MTENRQSGRSTRIINFIIEQLLSVGECICTDHVAFEYKGKINKKDCNEFADRVKFNLNYQLYRKNKKFSYEIHKINDVLFIYFKLTQKENVEEI